MGQEMLMMQVEEVELEDTLETGVMEVMQINLLLQVVEAEEVVVATEIIMMQVEEEVEPEYLEKEQTGPQELLEDRMAAVEAAVLAEKMV